MVSFTNAGRLGNWMFEAATCIAYALKHDLEFTVPASTHDQNWQPVYKFELVNPKFNPHLEAIRLWENGHNYQELPFQEDWRNKNIIIEGYRQSEKYFKDYRSEILYILDIPYEAKPDTCAIHIRRGDYLTLPDKHPAIPDSYFVEAMKKINAETGITKFKVYSDDIPYCVGFFNKIKCFVGFDADVMFSTGNYEMTDMADAAGCFHNIGSSSTFSWWIAWLNRNPDKIVITPKLWFVPNYSLDTKDIIPDEWIKM
jgi:hypothetical protein